MERRAQWSRQPFEIAVKLSVIHFDKISPIKRIDTGLDLRAQCFQFQCIFSPPLLERAERVADRLARILVLACLHNPFDEGVLLVTQADVTSRACPFSPSMSE